MNGVPGVNRREVITGLAAASLVGACSRPTADDFPRRRKPNFFGGMTIYNERMLPSLAGTFPAYTDFAPRVPVSLRDSGRHRLHPSLLRQFAVQPVRPLHRRHAPAVRRSPAKARRCRARSPSSIS